MAVNRYGYHVLAALVLLNAHLHPVWFQSWAMETHLTRELKRNQIIFGVECVARDAQMM